MINSAKPWQKNGNLAKTSGSFRAAAILSKYTVPGFGSFFVLTASMYWSSDGQTASALYTTGRFSIQRWSQNVVATFCHHRTHMFFSATSESGNMHLKSSPMPSLLFYDRCLATVFSIHSTNAFTVDVDLNVVRSSIIPDVVAEGTLANVAFDTIDGPEAGATTDELAGVCCWLFTWVLCFSDWACDFKAFTPNVPSFTVFLQKVQWASKTFPSTSFHQALNVLLFKQVLLHF